MGWGNQSKVKNYEVFLGGFGGCTTPGYTHLHNIQSNARARALRHTVTAGPAESRALCAHTNWRCYTTISVLQ
jgi:hypothetical protein